MIDVVTLALARKAASSGGTVSSEEIEAAVNKYLKEHPIQTTTIDKTLTQEDEAADAKAVGDAIKQIEENLENMGYLTKDEVSSIPIEEIASLF